jgi:hypothetical protein
MGNKADTNDFVGRFREIVSDPLNLAIRRDSRAGFLDGQNVFLHNGLKVPASGPLAYYGNFSLILVINRGVHEPLEEFVFQELLAVLPESPTMLELGSYWAHYSMWLKSARPQGSVHLVEADPNGLAVGQHNFALNGFTGEFTCAFVGKDKFQVDSYMREKNLEHIDILHSDIQGHEVEMLLGGFKTLNEHRADYLFISTHSQEIHRVIQQELEKFQYRIEVSSDVDNDTTSFDGFIFASSPKKQPVFKSFKPLGRTQIENATPKDLIEYAASLNAPKDPVINS